MESNIFYALDSSLEACIIKAFFFFSSSFNLLGVFLASSSS
jgi:hypothetical protein